MIEKLRDEIAQSMGVDPSVFASPNVTVAPDERRAESHVSTAYAFGDHLVVFCDPAAEAILREGVRDMEPTLDAWCNRAGELGGEFLGIGRNQVLAVRDLAEPVLVDGFEFRVLDRDDAAHMAMIQRLIDVSDPDDVDEAEIEMDNMDPFIDVVVDEQREIASFAAARPFETASTFYDIGILTRADCRAQGLGTAAVMTLCRHLLAENAEPLYRCDEDNQGSVALSAGMGFEVAHRLAAFRFAAG